MLIRKKGTEYRLEFAYNVKIIEDIKARFPHPHRRFDYNDKHWYIKGNLLAELYLFANRWGFALEDDTEVEEDFTINPMPNFQLTIPLKREPYPYQKEGIQYAYNKKRCIIGDKPGLGKTGQAIAAVLAHDAFPCLVICPDDPGPDNWEREWGLWTSKRAKVITPAVVRYLNRWVETDMIHVFIVGYSSLKKYFVESIDRKEGQKLTMKNIKFNSRKDIFKSVIVDESHKCANFTTLRTKLVKGITNNKDVKYLLSGTAYVNKPMDLAPQLGILDRLDDLGGYKYFKQRYCAGDKQASNLKELNYRLSETCYFSRNKEDVLTDLPPKTRQIIYVDLDPVHRLEYEKAENDLKRYLQEFKNADSEQIARALRGEAMVRIGICKNIAARGKLAGVKQFIADAIEGGEKMVVFLHQHEVLHAMTAEFPNALTLTGLDAKATRMATVDRFQTDTNRRLILVSMKVGGELITLTASSHVGFIELGWNPATHDQCEDRCHRIGQKDNVMSSFFLARNTIDEWNYNLIESKRQDSDIILGGVSGDVETNIVDNLAQAWLPTKQPTA